MPGGNYPRTKENRQKMSNSMKRAYKNYHGSNHPNWNGGTTSYWSRKGREAWEKHFGFKAPVGCDVHHMDGDNTNNSINNLALMTHGRHVGLHNQIKNKRLKRDRHGRFMKLGVTIYPEIYRGRQGGVNDKSK